MPLAPKVPVQSGKTASLTVNLPQTARSAAGWTSPEAQALVTTYEVFLQNTGDSTIVRGAVNTPVSVTIGDTYNILVLAGSGKALLGTGYHEGYVMQAGGNVVNITLRPVKWEWSAYINKASAFDPVGTVDPYHWMYIQTGLNVRVMVAVDEPVLSGPFTTYTFNEETGNYEQVLLAPPPLINTPVNIAVKWEELHTDFDRVFVLRDDLDSLGKLKFPLYSRRNITQLAAYKAYTIPISEGVLVRPADWNFESNFDVFLACSVTIFDQTTDWVFGYTGANSVYDAYFVTHIN